jgi:hypothetical protein
VKQKKLPRAIQNKRGGMVTSIAVLVLTQLLALEHCLSISTGSCLTTLLTALISLRATTTCLPTPTSRTDWDHSASTIMSWWKVSKHGWAHRRQTSLTHAYRNLFPYTSDSIPVVTMFRSSLSMYVFLYIIIFFLIACFVNSSAEVTFRIALLQILVVCRALFFGL